MKTVQLFDNCLSITIPDSFIEMDDAEIRKLFIGSAIPTYSFIDREEHSIISVIRTGQELPNNQILQRISAYQQNYARMVPGFVMGQMAVREVNGKTVYAMTFQSNAATETVMNVVALTSMNGEELLLYCITPLNGKTNANFTMMTKVISSLVIEEAEKNDF